MSAEHHVCVTCGAQFAASEGPPAGCAICEDERQYVGEGGQRWTTLGELRRGHANVVAEEEDGLWSIHPQPKAGIGQRAFLVRTAEGNLLWDCVPLIDDATVAAVRARGGVRAVAISHPHYYSAMVEWSRAFGGAPVYVHRDDGGWVMRPDGCVRPWEGEEQGLFGGVTLVRTGGHFDGFQVAHWPGGAGGRGVLLVGDQPFVCADRRWVSFMYSYPNLIPLGPAAVRGVAARLGALAYDRVYGAFPGQVVASGARGVVERSAERYVRRVGG